MSAALNLQIVMSAQIYVEGFYKRFGFTHLGNPYLEGAATPSDHDRNGGTDHMCPTQVVTS